MRRRTVAMCAHIVRKSFSVSSLSSEARKSAHFAFIASMKASTPPSSSARPTSVSRASASFGPDSSSRGKTGSVPVFWSWPTLRRDGLLLADQREGRHGGGLALRDRVVDGLRAGGRAGDEHARARGLAERGVAR